ncbi:MAG: sigma-70 family RNA polymerase sigma factor [Candidatus Obscuribacter sp.]|nr:sigma-70 family RNA polymerase sigma factor [Candidatus Obscuribacter sp.]
MSKLRESFDWVAKLNGPGQKEAIHELSALLLKSLGNFNLPVEDKEDIVQDSLTKILTRLSTFEGRSSFVSWAVAIALNVALNKIRRIRWKIVSLEEATQLGVEFESQSSTEIRPDLQAERSWSLHLVEQIIMKDLTQKQRVALLAEINGMPLQEIATRMSISRGGIYKLTFDARKRLVRELAKHGLSAEDLIKS